MSVSLSMKICPEPVASAIDTAFELPETGYVSMIVTPSTRTS